MSFSELPPVLLPSSIRVVQRPDGFAASGSRKEVFQPHLPVRLPCYDLAPVTGIALVRLGILQALPAPMA